MRLREPRRLLSLRGYKLRFHSGAQRLAAFAAGMIYDASDVSLVVLAA